jgi:hypothetical protein
MIGQENVARQAPRDANDGRELLDRLRQITERWALWERTRARLTSGMSVLDAVLGGGWPAGRIAEIVGSASSGRTGIAVATAASATRRGEVVAWIDLADAFAPLSGAAAGMNLGQVLWIRPSGIGEAVRAAELVLETSGFPVVVLDLAQTPDPRAGVGGKGGWPAFGAGRPVPGWRGGKNSLRLRIARAAERAGAVVLVLADRPWIGTMAGVTVMLERGRALWSAPGGRAPRWLVGLDAHLRVERGSADVIGRRVSLRLSWVSPDVNGGCDAGRLPENTRLSFPSTAAC